MDSQHSAVRRREIEDGSAYKGADRRADGGGDRLIVENQKLLYRYIVGTERSIEALRTTIIFGLWAVIPYMVYLIALYFLVGSMKLPYALLGGVLCWTLAAWLLISLWTRFHG